MSGIELGLALVGVVDVCYRYGKSLVKTCQAFKDADSQLREHTVRVEACWIRIEAQIQVVRSLAALMGERHRRVHHQTLEVLLTKLRTADSKLASLIKPPSLATVSLDSKLTTVEARKRKYALLREGLVEAISDLEAWQVVFDPTWFLMMKIASPEVDRQLEVTTRQRPGTPQRKSSTYIPAAQRLRDALGSRSDVSEHPFLLRRDGLVPGSTHPVPFSPANTALRAGSNGQIVLLDPVNCTSRPSVSAVLKDVRNFAKKLQYADPFTFGLLECKGVVKDESELPGKPAYPSYLVMSQVSHSYFASPQATRKFKACDGACCTGLRTSTNLSRSGFT
jgi:hypothetical protein